MNLVLQHLPEDIQGIARSKHLAPEAALALRMVEKDTDGLVYTNFWHDATSTMMAKRIRFGSHLPGYDPHNYGLAVSLDTNNILGRKKITYEDVLYIMKKRGFFCHRRDGKQGETGSNHFNYLGDNADAYLEKASFDPLSWDNPAEARIHEKHLAEFSLSPAQVQSLLAKIGFFHGPIDGNLDLYFREAVSAFQRAWDLPESGNPSIQFQRVLAFVSADVSFIH